MEIVYKDRSFKFDHEISILDFLKEKDADVLKTACCARIKNSIKDLRDVFGNNYDVEEFYRNHYKDELNG